jgi:hypothetical protein
LLFLTVLFFTKDIVGSRKELLIIFILMNV